MSLRRGVLIRILALLQRKMSIETKNRTLKCFKWHNLTVRAMNNVAVLTEDGAFALFFGPHPGGFDSWRVPTPENLPSKAKKMLMPGGQLGVGAGRWWNWLMHYVMSRWWGLKRIPSSRSRDIQKSAKIKKNWNKAALRQLVHEKTG